MEAAESERVARAWRTYAQQTGGDADAAFARLTDLADATDTPLDELAHMVVTGAVKFK